MQQSCPDCERDATLGAKFCRTCGNRLEIESDVTTATTREYPSQIPAQAPAAAFHQAHVNGTYQQPPLAMNAEADAGGVDTARFYTPPAAAAPPMMSPPGMMMPPQKKSSYAWVFWALLGMAVISLMFMVFGVLFFRPGSHRTSRRPVTPVGVPAPPDAPPPPPPAPGQVAVGQLTIEQLKYPNAEIEKEVTVMGQEIVTMTTDDDLDEVREFYSDVFKSKPMVEDHRENKVVFQNDGEQHQMVVIEPSDENPGKLKIVAMRFGQKPSMDTLFKVRDRQKAQEEMKKAQEEMKKAQEEMQRQAGKIGQ